MIIFYIKENLTMTKLTCPSCGTLFEVSQGSACFDYFVAQNSPIKNGFKEGIWLGTCPSCQTIFRTDYTNPDFHLVPLFNTIKALQPEIQKLVTEYVSFICTPINLDEEETDDEEILPEEAMDLLEGAIAKAFVNVEGVDKESLKRLIIPNQVAANALDNLGIEPPY
jgi:hypothetical protein